ncbi:MAG: ABC transporter ATP-binding protein [Thermoplasmatota archaeon]
MAAEGAAPAVLVEGLTKRFGAVTALSDVSFEVRRGEVFGVLGSNGAGKSTALKTVCGLLRPDRGRVVVAGVDALRDPVEAKRRIGFLPEAPALYDQLTGREFLEMLGTLRGMRPPELDERVGKLLEAMELEAFQDCNIGTYSRGMRQKLALSSAILHDPEVLVLDEPLSGLDPRFAKLIKGWLRERAEDGGSVLMSTHVTSSAEELCDRVAVLDRGRVLVTGAVAEVLEAAGAGNLEDAFVAIVGGRRWVRSPFSRRTP